MKTVLAIPDSRRMPSWTELLPQAVGIVIGGGLIFSVMGAMQSFDLFKRIINNNTNLDPCMGKRQQAKKGKEEEASLEEKSVELNEFEQALASNLINPEDINVGWNDVSGLDNIIRELTLKVLFPLRKPELFCITLWKQTKGVLLYGPPGTGKTMLAKALAKQSVCRFLNISASSIMSRMVGDSCRLVRAAFTLAAKQQPCIIFIDEVEALLGKRTPGEHEALLQVKTEFMQLWDGMESGREQRVVVMGATNRPWMVDEAVLRRFGTQHEIRLPGEAQRTAILQGCLSRHRQEISAAGAGERSVSQALLLDEPDEGSGGVGAVTWIAQRTDGYSGSDLVELCSYAAQAVLEEFWEANPEELPGARGAEPAEISGMRVRELRRSDLEAALAVVRPSAHKANEYQSKSDSGPAAPTWCAESERLAMLMTHLLAAGKIGVPS